MDCSTPGFPVLRHLPEFAQIHVHRVGGAIQPSHPLPPFPLQQTGQLKQRAFIFSQSWGLEVGDQSVGSCGPSGGLSAWLVTPPPRYVLTWSSFCTHVSLITLCVSRIPLLVTPVLLD